MAREHSAKSRINQYLVSNSAFCSENALFQAYLLLSVTLPLERNFSLHFMQIMNAERPAVPLDRRCVEVSKICRRLKLFPTNIAMFLWSTRSQKKMSAARRTIHAQ
jgi:hypothetical protein